MVKRVTECDLSLQTN